MVDDPAAGGSKLGGDRPRTTAHRVVLDEPAHHPLQIGVNRLYTIRPLIAHRVAHRFPGTGRDSQGVEGPQARPFRFTRGLPGTGGIKGDEAIKAVNRQVVGSSPSSGASSELESAPKTVQRALIVGGTDGKIFAGVGVGSPLGPLMALGRPQPLASALASCVRDVMPSLGNRRYRCEPTVRCDR